MVTYYLLRKVDLEMPSHLKISSLNADANTKYKYLITLTSVHFSIPKYFSPLIFDVKYFLGEGLLKHTALTATAGLEKLTTQTEHISALYSC